MATTVMWFRRDLRLADNPALLEAVRNGDDVVPLFVVDDALWGPAGDNRRAFLIGCLRALDDSTGGHLVVRRGLPQDVVPAVARQVGAPWVFVAEDFGPYGRARDAAVARALVRGGAALAVVDSPYAVPPGEIRTASGTPYRVFTPFSRVWLDHGWPDPVRAPRRPSWSTALRRERLPAAPRVEARLPEPGEAAATRAARRFIERAADGYADHRDQPGADATSRLSPYLKWGCLHPRQLLARLDDTQSHQRFRTELCWRDFCADVVHHDPAAAGRSSNVRMRAMRTDRGVRADARFDAWAAGRTGYPIVDAGMRQLLIEGWMHNRVRMIAASFLVKDLHLDWTRGARHFMRHLVDGDLASNSQGWQWVAGTGVDASPYFRVFNPVSQSRRYDPDGTYIRRYVPELADLAAPFVHEPWTNEGGPPPGYPAPIVDHDVERVESLRRHAAIRQGSQRGGSKG